ncbi:MAG: AraC family transcriptional regulator [Pseudomonadota bacterium]
MEESTFFVQNLSISPIGGIRIACFVKNGAGVLTPRRTLPHYTLVYVLRGGGRYFDENDVARKVRPGDAILVLPGIEHWYGPPRGERWDELYLVFEGPVFDLWRDNDCLSSNSPVFPLRPTEYWLERIKRAIGASHNGDPKKMLGDALRMQGLLADIGSTARSEVSTELLWLEQARLALRNSLSVQDAAGAMGMTYEAFRKKFRKLSGQPPGRYKTEVAMEQACEMLSTSNVTLKHIANNLGYCDEYHFSKQFSKAVGWSPSEYRARIGKRTLPIQNQRHNRNYG